MSALAGSAWLLLGAALFLLPPGDPESERARTLVRQGRLDATEHGWRGFQRISVAGIPPPVVGAVAGVAVLVGAGAPLGLGSATVATTGWYLGRAAIRRRGVARARGALLTALRMIESELAAGSRPAAALEAAAAGTSGDRGRLQAGFAAAARRASGGADPFEQLVDVPDLAPLAHAWQLGTTVGAPLAEVVGRVADDVASRVRQARLVSSSLASARSSAALLAMLPALGVVLGAAMDANPVGFLIGTRPGQWLLCAGVVLDAAGLLWTHRLTVRAEGP